MNRVEKHGSPKMAYRFVRAVERYPMLLIAGFIGVLLVGCLINSVILIALGTLSERTTDKIGHPSRLNIIFHSIGLGSTLWFILAFANMGFSLYSRIPLAHRDIQVGWMWLLMIPMVIAPLMHLIEVRKTVTELHHYEEA